MSNDVKQVIVIRKDLKMRRGKEIAQGAHASMSFLSDRIRRMGSGILISDEERKWLFGRFTKICLQVDSEQELLEVYQKAKDAGLTAFLITDSGVTEFNGIPTNTCCAIGPDVPDKIDNITGKLKLY